MHFIPGGDAFHVMLAVYRRCLRAARGLRVDYVRDKALANIRLTARVLSRPPSRMRPADLLSHGAFVVVVVVAFGCLP